jgi:hypothetical protein
MLAGRRPLDVDPTCSIRAAHSPRVLRRSAKPVLSTSSRLLRAGPGGAAAPSRGGRTITHAQGRGSSRGAVGHTQLGEHAHQVGLDRRLRDGQLPADRPAGEAAPPGSAPRCRRDSPSGRREVHRTSQTSVAELSHRTLAVDDDQERRARLLLLGKEESWLTAWYARSLPIRTNTSREPVVADVPNSDGSSTSQRHQWLRTRANGIDGPLDETGGAGRKIGEQNVPLVDGCGTHGRVPRGARFQ